MPALKIIEHKLPGLPMPATMVLMFAGSAGYAMLMNIWVEKPIAR
jgi:hypothetical protein